MPRTKQPTPAELTEGWPRRASDDPSAETARQVALVLIDLVELLGLRGVARTVDFDHPVIKNVIDGKTWPSLQLIDRLERVLRRRVWPNGSMGYRLGDGRKMVTRLRELAAPAQRVEGAEAPSPRA